MSTILDLHHVRAGRARVRTQDDFYDDSFECHEEVRRYYRAIDVILWSAALALVTVLCVAWLA